jgi:tetratricopeptide (TPR) repeat protein
LSREDRLAIEGQYFEAARQYDKAAERFGSLFTYFPDNLEYGLRLAAVQESAGNGKQALDTLGTLRKLPPPAGSDPRIDVTEAVTARLQRQSQRGVDAAQRAAKTALALGATQVLARARFEEGSNLQNIGKWDEAVAALSEAEKLFRQVGDRRGVAASVNNRGLVMAQRGKLDETEKTWSEALAIYRSIGNKSGEALLVGNLGNVEYVRGNVIGARRRWEQTLPIYREINEPEGEARMLNNIASVVGELGDIAGARGLFEQSLAIYRRIGQKSGMLSTAGNIARSWHEEGDLAAAERSYKEVLALWKETGDKEAAAPFIEKYGDLLLEKGDVTGARQAYTEALGLWQAMKAGGQADSVQLALLALDLDAGKAKEAESPVRQLLDAAVKQKSSAREANARLLLARIAVAQGRVADAKREAEQARTLTAKNEDRSVRLRQEIECARVLGLLGDTDRNLATQALRHARLEAERMGAVPLALEARVTLGEIEVKTSPAATKARLRELQKEAELKGFKAIAQRAAAAAK